MKIYMNYIIPSEIADDIKTLYKDGMISTHRDLIDSCTELGYTLEGVLLEHSAEDFEGAEISVDYI